MRVPPDGNLPDIDAIHNRGTARPGKQASYRPVPPARRVATRLTAFVRTRMRQQRELICPSCQRVAGTFACDVGQITGNSPRVPCPHEGRFAIVTDAGRGMRWTLWREGRARVRRTAKSCGPDIPMLMSSWRRCVRIAPVTETTKPVFEEITKETVKTIRAGNAGMFGEPVVTLLVCFLFLHARPRVSCSPGIPCALCLQEGCSGDDSEAFASRE